jgi:SagB-type dehydrogenase family enzyme
MDLSADAAADFYNRTKLSLTDWRPGEELLPPIEHGQPVVRRALPRVPVSAWPSLEQSIVARRTSRSFDPLAVLSLDFLARLLTFSCGLTAPMDLDRASFGYHRAVPSAGARYPIDMYFVGLRVAEIPCGAYWYDSSTHEIGLVRPGFYGNHIARWAFDQPWMANAGVLFALVATPARIKERYSARGYRYLLFEAGHIAQNLYLLGSAGRICVQATGGFYEDAFVRLFGLDEEEQQVLYLIAAGWPDSSRGLAAW